MVLLGQINAAIVDEPSLGFVKVSEQQMGMLLVFLVDDQSIFQFPSIAYIWHKL
jgi:hypothetical protein